MKNLKLKMKNKIEETTGITLIALVITIVVLIILASVAINLSIGDNGIFNRARTAKEQYSNAENYEKTEIAKYTNEIDNIVTNSRNLTSRTILFNGNQSSGTITFSENKISDFEYYEFIFGCKEEPLRYFSQIVSKDFIEIGRNMSSDSQVIISGAQTNDYMASIMITNVTENSITYSTAGGYWQSEGISIFKIIGIK